jgi:hypothetical protein
MLASLGKVRYASKRITSAVMSDAGFDALVERDALAGPQRFSPRWGPGNRRQGQNFPYAMMSLDKVKSGWTSGLERPSVGNWTGQRALRGRALYRKERRQAPTSRPGLALIPQRAVRHSSCAARSSSARRTSKHFALTSRRAPRQTLVNVKVLSLSSSAKARSHTRCSRAHG